MDENSIRSLADELNAHLRGSRVEEVRQPVPEELVLQLWGRGRKTQLALVLSAPEPRVVLRDEKCPNAPRPPRFCQLLRARFKTLGAITGVAGHPWLALGGSGPGQEELVLVVDLSLPRGNLLLVAAGRVIDLLYRCPRGRGPQPGDPLALPLLPPAEAARSQRSVLEEMAALDRQLRNSPSATELEELRRSLARASRRLERRLEKIASDLARHARAPELRQKAELLLVERHRLRRGMSSLTVTNLYADPPVALTISVDPALAPDAQIEQLFHQARKGERARLLAGERLALTRQVLDELAQLAVGLEAAPTEIASRHVRNRLGELGLWSPPRPRGMTPPVSEPWRTFRSPGGFTVLVGRNNRANDRLLRELARPEDLWFHARAVPGAHVLLRRQRQQPVPDADRTFAAAVAAGFSRAREEERVEVSQALCRDVRKPSGAGPGQVVVLASFTLVVKPLRLPDEP